ncbi:heme biosynthesis protein HemY [Aureimonas endophytica]|uniref:Heme biosynthesis protein HemY n=1 Tax=Aureimonas endophytica TaxID=2027858 RepID=A0A917E815_9HYPH|nr:heme biosynthesis HemY N-terminal domain-containing protein [Aureimonas endophytica]GGE08309.1 heme biosynthesis protein HemY [Aureimonas endophytica]
MLRILAFLLIVLAAALGFSWLQDHPGAVSLTLGNAVMETSFTVFVVLELLLLGIVCLVVWLVRSFFKAPDRVGRFFSTRRRDKGYHALSSGIIAAGAGDAALARRMTKRSQKLLAARKEPLVRFLDAQTAMIEGDHERARAVFQSMENEPETRLLAMRGLYLEAERLGDAAAARHYAERAARIAPHVPWAGGAVLESKTIEGDYDGALAILEAQRDARLIEKAESSRLRAVLLTAKAKTLLDRDPAQARKAALEAVSLAPTLVPAAVTAARAMFRLGDVRKGSNVIERAWEKTVHPELASTYIHARAGDSAEERLKRARTLASLQPTHVETHLMLANAAIDAGDLTLARIEATAALRKEPREGVFLLLADLEEAEGGSEGAVREWLGRAVRAPRDPAWTADGIVAEDWAPVSPVTGRLDAFEWKVPAQHVDAHGAVIEGERPSARERLAARPAETGPNRNGNGGHGRVAGPAAPVAAASGPSATAAPGGAHGAPDRAIAMPAEPAKGEGAGLRLF